jgi:hypothetical protein
MIRTKVFRRKSVRCLLVSLLATSTILEVHPPALANHSYGAHYAGPHSRPCGPSGGTFEFDTTDNGASVTNVQITNLLLSSSPLKCLYLISEPGPWPVSTTEPHTFAKSTGTVIFDGTFDAPQHAQGTFRYLGADSTPTVSWSATTDTPPPAEDADPPTAKMTAPTAPFTLARQATLRWTGSDAGSGVADYSVRYRRAPYWGGFGSWVYPVEWQNMAASQLSVSFSPLATGYDYCFAVRARDNAGNSSKWSAGRCIARPLDDRALTAGSAWNRATSTRFWNRTATVTTRQDAELIRTGTRVDRLALVATRCPTCGTVGLYVNGVRKGAIRLQASGRQYRHLIVLPKFAYSIGPTTLKVLSAGKIVQIDGLGISRT